MCHGTHAHIDFDKHQHIGMLEGCVGFDHTLYADAILSVASQSCGSVSFSARLEFTLVQTQTVVIVLGHQSVGPPGHVEGGFS